LQPDLTLAYKTGSPSGPGPRFCSGWRFPPEQTSAASFCRSAPVGSGTPQALVSAPTPHKRHRTAMYEYVAFAPYWRSHHSLLCVRGSWRRDGYGTKRLALPRAGLLSLKGYALTPQAFSISNLVFGPVLHHPGNRYYNIPAVGRCKASGCFETPVILQLISGQRRKVIERRLAHRAFTFHQARQEPDALAWYHGGGYLKLP